MLFSPRPRGLLLLRQVLLLLGVFLLQLLSLLLVLLLQLLSPGSIRVVLGYTLMLLLLLLLKFLMFLILLLGQLGLLLLVFLIACSISRAGNCGWLSKAD